MDKASYHYLIHNLLKDRYHTSLIDVSSLNTHIQIATAADFKNSIYITITPKLSVYLYTSEGRTIHTNNLNSPQSLQQLKKHITKYLAAIHTDTISDART